MEKNLVWSLESDTTRAQVINAHKAIKEIADSEYALKVNEASEKNVFLFIKDKPEKVIEKNAWAEFKKNPIEFFNLLEEIAPNSLGKDEDFLGGLSKETAKVLNAEALPLDGLNCTLRKYQDLGVRFILHQGNVLLGDEMGLGKTIQAIACMVATKNFGGNHFFVICPAGILPNWSREISKHCNLDVLKIHGKERKIYFEHWLKNGGVAVTSYETARALQFPSNAKIDLLVVDEAHYVKNPDAKRSQNVASITNKASKTLFMTGTALENEVEEMINLISFLDIKIAREAKKYTYKWMSDEFHECIAPVYYRRKREDVLKELPALIEYKTWCEMGDEELKDYEHAALRHDRTAMRRVSWATTNIKHSSKMKRLKEIVKEAKAEDRRVLVFSFYLDTIDAIYNELGNIACPPITGSVSVKKRQEIIDEFEQSPSGSVLIAQITSGGVGLNIQAASIVVICEPQYKPSTENQAISRAYRMGQPRNVIVHRLLAEDTIDERILEILSRKQAEFDVYADPSLSGEKGAEISKKEQESIIEKEIERIKAKYGKTDETPKKQNKSKNDDKGTDKQKANKASTKEAKDTGTRNKSNKKPKEVEEEPKIHPLYDLTSSKFKEADLEHIHVEDFVVRTKYATCNVAEHDIKEVRAVVCVFSYDGGLKEVTIDAFCCPKCRRFFILEKDYHKLLRQGIPCCQIISNDEDPIKFILNDNEYNDELNEESFLRSLGYTVNAQDNLSDWDRWKILDFVIENGFRTQSDVIGFLNWLIDFHGRRSNMENAVKKWNKDIEYLIKGNNRSPFLDRVRVRRIFLSRRSKW